MIKLKDLLKESKYAWDRKFGDPLPTFKDVAETHQNKPSVNEAAPKMGGRPGEKELKSISRQLERLKHIDISGRHISKLKSAIDSTKKSVAKIEKIIRMSSTL